MLIILFITYTLSVVSQLERLILATIREDKIIAIYSSPEFNNFNARVFELKEGKTADIFNSGRTFDFGHKYEKVDLDILDIPESLQGDKNKLWLRYSLLESFDNSTAPPLMNWVGYIDLDDMSLKNDSSLIKFPIDENFPVKGYTINRMINGLESALYVTGGELYSKKDNIYLPSSSFYKYNFTSKEWADLTNTVNGKLKPLFDYKSIAIGNRYLVMFGRRDVIYNLNSDRTKFEYNPSYNLTIFDTFNNSWESVNIDIKAFNINTKSIQLNDILTATYNDKIIVYVRGDGDSRSNMRDINKYLGILNLESKSWTWSPVQNKYDQRYIQSIYERYLVVFNDQIIIFSGKLNYINI
jgi:hypothetical protein